MKRRWRSPARLTLPLPPDWAVFGRCWPHVPPLADCPENGRLLFCAPQRADSVALWKGTCSKNSLAISGVQSDISSLTLGRKEDHNGQEGIITLRA